MSTPSLSPTALRLVLAGSVLVGCVLVTNAQQFPPRDLNSAPRTDHRGTASISGRIIDGSSNLPVRRATVVAVNRSAASVSRMSVTNDLGEFSFKDLPAGRYGIVATKPAYLPTAYGVDKPTRAGSLPVGTAIPLTEGQHKSAVSLKITRGGVVSGTVRTADGSPARALLVSLAFTLRAPLTGDRTLAFLPSAGTSTDSRGQYRIFGIPPGEYVVSVRPSPVSGVALNDLELTTDTDEQRIRELISGTGRVQNLGAGYARRPAYGFAPVFYPGTTTLSEAVPVEVRSNDERTGIDLLVGAVPQGRVSGAVVGLDGRPASGVIVRLTTAQPYSAGPFITSLQATTDAQGSYVIGAVPPGDYQLEVRPPIRRTSSTAPVGWAQSAVHIAPGADHAINLSLAAGLTVVGTINADSQLGGMPDITTLRVALVNRDGLSLDAVLTRDGQFTFEGILPDSYRITVSQSGVSGSPWTVKSGTVEGRDAFDSFTEIRHDSRSSIVLTQRVTEVFGQIQDREGAPAPEYTLVVFPVDKELWTWQSRRIQQVRPDHDGKFRFANLPAGEYLLGAVTDVEPNQWFEAAFLAQLLDGSVRFVLAEGEKKTQNIRLR